MKKTECDNIVRTSIHSGPILKTSFLSLKAVHRCLRVRVVWEREKCLSVLRQRPQRPEFTSNTKGDNLMGAAGKCGVKPNSAARMNWKDRGRGRVIPAGPAQRQCKGQLLFLLHCSSVLQWVCSNSILDCNSYLFGSGLFMFHCDCHASGDRYCSLQKNTTGSLTTKFHSAGKNKKLILPKK